MARESSIDARDGWFVGEHKLLRFTIDGVETDIDDWELAFALYEGNGDLVFSKSTAAGITAVDAAICQVEVQAADTAALTPGVYQYVLSRTDAGAEGVLAYGAAALGSAVPS